MWAHDSNYSFFDEKKLYYLKLERFFVPTKNLIHKIIEKNANNKK